MRIKRHKDFIVESKEDNNLWIYEGDFDVDESMIMNGKFIDDKIPDIVTGYFDCSNLNLTSLEGGPKEVKSNFLSDSNKLMSLEGGPKKIGGSYFCNENNLINLYGCPEKIGRHIYSELQIERNFINSGSYINNYWEDLLKYMIKEKISLEEVKGWPEGFLNNEVIKSVKGLSKFNL